MAPEVQTKLCLVAEAGLEPAALAALLGAVEAAALLVAPAAERSLDARSARPLVELAQEKGIAALVAADAALARTLRADGVHLPWSKEVMARYREARDMLGARFIVGADAGRSRHDAMTLGEAGADYVGFGIPAHVGDRDGARARRLELVGWWSEIFEVPCVALDVETAEEAGRLAAAGADFVALRAPAWPAAELARWGEDVMRALRLPEAAA